MIGLEIYDHKAESSRWKGLNFLIAYLDFLIIEFGCLNCRADTFLMSGLKILNNRN